MTSLLDVITEALNSAYMDEGGDHDRAELRKHRRHDGHKNGYYGGCYVCRGDVDELAERVRLALLDARWIRLELVEKLREIADYYPAHIFTPEGKTPDGIAGTAIRERCLAEIRRLEEADHG